MENNVRGKLEFGTLIGEGQFGKVYEAVDPIQGKVAVKVLARLVTEKDIETEIDWNARKIKLVDEGKRLKAAEHENIVRVYHVTEAETEDAIYLTMELCRGSLATYYDKGPLSLLSLRDMLVDAASGLQILHARGMLHRDIKPSNLLIDHRGTVKIGDFGLVTDEIMFGYASTKYMYPNHFAPELFENGQTSTRTDVWSFGMMTYRLIHGADFFNRVPSPDDAIMDGDKEVGRSLPWLPHVPKSWRSFVWKSLRDNPNERLQSGTQIVQQLRRLQIDPKWTCIYAPDQVVWKRHGKNQRVIEVCWSIHNAKKHEWQAYSLPDNGEGRPYRLKGSEGFLNKKEAERQLQEYLCST